MQVSNKVLLSKPLYMLIDQWDSDIPAKVKRTSSLHPTWSELRGNGLLFAQAASLQIKNGQTKGHLQHNYPLNHYLDAYTQPIDIDDIGFWICSSLSCYITAAVAVANKHIGLRFDNPQSKRGGEGTGYSVASDEAAYQWVGSCKYLFFGLDRIPELAQSGQVAFRQNIDKWQLLWRTVGQLEQLPQRRQNQRGFAR